MPFKKSASSLENLCLTNIKRNIQNVNLQRELKRLPPLIIDELSSRMPPTTLIRHARMTQVKLQTRYDDDSVKFSLMLEEVSEFYKNLRRFTVVINDWDSRVVNCLLGDCLKKLILNNPHLRRLELNATSCSDSDLKVIGSHCSQLEYLSVLCCKSISDLGMTFLCMDSTGESRNLKIRKLNLLCTHVTSEGCLVGLSNLPAIKNLKHEDWHGVCKLLVHKLECGKTLPMLENLQYHWERKYFDVVNRVLKALPKLRKFKSLWVVSDLHELLPNVNANLTSLTVTSRCVNIEVIDLCFPLLRELAINSWIDCFNYDIEELSSAEYHGSFKNLRKLALDGTNNFSVGHYKMLLANCLDLETLWLKKINLITDKILFKILEWNPLNKLKGIKLLNCQFTTTPLRRLLEMNNVLTSIEIKGWVRFDDGRQFDDIKSDIKRLNLDVAFRLSYCF